MNYEILIMEENMATETKKKDFISRFYECHNKINTDPEIKLERYLYRLALINKRQENGTKAYKKLFKRI